MGSSEELVGVKLPNGATMHVQATVLGGEEDVAFGWLSFDEVSKTLEGIAGAISGAVQKVKPTKAVVELGLELAVESGKLTTLLVKGNGKANLRIVLEWAT
ncbi:CU044_2847 family protein [Accumulibacter sp.]|uniref:CU044_2847 family protein n=1 Tax=Accumulibacter sp. TaxID=2053492 RepID=UPI001AD31C33|nr:CU044_2847 family protein [Accumulibacter sp.]MBN8456167.1 hypothetical protein [Accumulibacter sp.]MBO3708201.1 hypothetical protein [Candidatus Accumulibacter conexus]